MGESVLDILTKIREQLIDISEGKSAKDDPEASIISYIDGLIDSIDCTMYDIKDILKN